MAESTVILAAICGSLLACAPVFVVSGRRNAPLRLSDALAGLSDYGRQDAVVDLAAEGGRLERWGTRAAIRWPRVVSERSRRTLILQGRTPGDLVIEKAVMAMGGMLVPALVRAVAAACGDTLPVTPVGLAVVLAVVGWFIPTPGSGHGLKQCVRMPPRPSWSMSISSPLLDWLTSQLRGPSSRRRR